MKIYSFENQTIQKDGLYDLVKKTIVNKIDLDVDEFVVPDEFDGRLDLVSKHFYGSGDYVEELMVMNGLINPFTIKTGDVIYYIESGKMKQLYQKDEENDSAKQDILKSNKSKSTATDSSRKDFPPSLKPNNIQQVSVNHSKKKITVLNKLK